MLKNLEAYKKNNLQTSNLEHISVLGIYLSVDPREHFPKLKNADGSNVKGDDGRVMRSEVSDGWTYTFSEYGTSKVIKVVLPEKVELEPLSPWIVTGEGYDMPSMFFIEKEGEVSVYQ